MSASPERDLVQLPLVKEAAAAHGFTSWEGTRLPRADSDVVITKWCTDQIQKLNPWASPAQAAEAVRELESILASTTTSNLVERAKAFLTALRAGVKVRDGARKRSVRVVDFDDPTANRWDIATEVTYRASRGTKAVRFDVVLYANGIPLVVVECKSMLDPYASWLTAAKDLSVAYTNRAPAFLAAALVQIATDGREVRYGAAKTAAQQYQRWGTTAAGRPDDETWEQVVYDFNALTDPARLCEWARDFIMHLSDRTTGQLTRYVPRWIQGEAAPLMAARAVDAARDRGLLVHFQGSGKTLAMLMAANAVLRANPSHVVIVVVDRLDLLSQHKQDFAQSDARRSVQEAETGPQLKELLGNPAISGLVITTVHRFADLGVLTKRADVTIMVDEAHRTQGTGEAQLGGQMRAALPNATLIGLTGTPVTDKERNTFEAFGCDGDPGQVLHRYTAADSVRDGTTVPLSIVRRRIVSELRSNELDEAYAAYADKVNLSPTDAEIVARWATRWDALLKDPRRIKTVADDVVADMTANVLPGGYGAMLVVADREACVLYADYLKTVLTPDQVTAVISGNKNDPDSYDPYVRSSADEALVVRDFRDPTKPLKLLIVTSKLLTGFDAKNCRTIYIDKPLKGHTLFQAVTRVNRTWVTPDGVEKGYGVVVDYCGVAPEVLKSFSQDAEDTTTQEIVNPAQLVTSFKRSLTGAEKVLGTDFSWTASLNDIIRAAKAQLKLSPKVFRVFRQNVHRAELIYETLSNNPAIRAERKRLRRLVQILDAYGRNAVTHHDRLVMAHGAAVRALVLEHTGDPLRADLDLVQLTPERIRALVGEPSNPAHDIEQIQSGEVMAKVRERLRLRMEGPHGQEYSSIAAKLERFAATAYVPTAEGVQKATLDLVDIVRQLKEVDDIVGEQWEDLDFELFGWRRQPSPVLEPERALQEILEEYAPDPMPAGLDDVAAVLDDIVGTLSYKSLLDDVAAQKKLQGMMLIECKRLGILPEKKDRANAFVEQLVGYVNAYLV